MRRSVFQCAYCIIITILKVGPNNWGNTGNDILSIIISVSGKGTTQRVRIQYNESNTCFYTTVLFIGRLYTVTCVQVIDYLIFDNNGTVIIDSKKDYSLLRR